MNKKNFISILIWGILISSFVSSVKAQKTDYDTTPYALDYHKERLEIFKKEPIVKGKIIFLGDSIIEFGDWQKLLNDSTVINRGIAGDITFGVLARLDDVIARQPAKLFIEVGINDIAKNNPKEIIVKNIVTIVQKVKAASPNTKFFVHSVLPTNDAVKKEYPNAFNKNDQVKAVNKILKSQAKKNQFVFIDTYKEFSDSAGKLKTDYADADGLHLNAKGYQKWIEILRKY